jgi:hypothetical protein
MNEAIASASRREFLCGLTATSLAAVGGLATSPAVAAGAAFGRGPMSGLPWYSGCTPSDIPGFEKYRGRRVDGYTIWCPHETWADIVSLKGGFSAVNHLSGRISMGLAPLPSSESVLKYPGNWQRAAKGDFDSYYSLFSSRLAASGCKNVIVRIGWESNHTRPWFCGVDPDGFKRAFARIAKILREQNPTVSIEWSNIKKGAQRGSILDSYPGDEAVDIIGVDYYDNWPALNTEAIWSSQYNATYYGGPYGIGAWLAFAKSRGKRFSCSEWGISVGTSPGTQDNPLYIAKMYEFFSRNAAYIAYENYFNQKGKQHQITPTYFNPKASAQYRALWGA